MNKELRWYRLPSSYWYNKGMYVVVGLGNPGVEYTHTRHNVGFRIADAVAVALSRKFAFEKKLQAEVVHSETATQPPEELYVLKPQTFMNRSGESVRSLYQYFGGRKPSPEVVQKLFVVLDDLDIPLGKYKIQLAKGPKVHNGLTSLYQQLGSNNFYHIRVGIENRGTDRSLFPGDRYVLSKFTSAEEDIIKQVIPQIVQELLKQTKMR